MNSGKEPSPAKRSRSDRSRSLDPIGVAFFLLFFFLPGILGLAAFSAEYLLLPVRLVLAFYHSHTWIIDRMGIGGAYRATGNPHYLDYAIYAASLPVILSASATVHAALFLRIGSDYVDLTRPGKGTLARALVFTLCFGAICFAGPRPYLHAMAVPIGPVRGHVRLSPDLSGAVLFAALVWLPGMLWSRLLAAGIGRTKQRVDHLLWRLGSRRRARDKIRRRDAVRRARLQPHETTIKRPNRD